MDLTTGEGKRNAVNFLLPYIQKIPNRLLRSEWATRIAQQLRLDEPVLRAELTKAAAERRGEMKVKPELIGRPAKPAERQLIRMLVDADEFRRDLATALQEQSGDLRVARNARSFLRRSSCANRIEGPIDVEAISQNLDRHGRDLLMNIVFDNTLHAATIESAKSCILGCACREARAGLV